MNTNIGVCSLACITGALVGFMVSPLVIEWFTTAFQLPLAETNTLGSRAIFAIGCSFLFASAPLTASMIARTSNPHSWIVYLISGCFVSAVVAWYLRASVATGVASFGAIEATAVSLRAFPNIVIPFSGILAIVSLGFIHRVRHGPTSSSR